MALQCEVVTPERKVFSSEAEFVVLPAAEGEMGVYPKHEPVVATLNAGSVRVTVEGAQEAIKFVVAGGYAQVEAQRVIVLANRAQAVADIDRDAVAAELDELKGTLEDLKPDDASYAYTQGEIDCRKLLLAQI